MSARPTDTGSEAPRVPQCPHGRYDGWCRSGLCFPPWGQLALTARDRDLKRCDVRSDIAYNVASMSDKRLAHLYLVNAIPAALVGPGSIFWQTQAAVIQEAKRRSLQLKGMLT